MRINFKKYFWTTYLIIVVAFGAFCFNVIAGPSVTGGGGGGGSALSEEQVEDFVGGMLGGTETGLSVTYVDNTNDIDFVVSTILQKYHGVDPSANVLTVLGCANNAAIKSALGYYTATSDLHADLQSLAGATAWRMFYSDAATPFIQEIVLGADGTFLESNGASAVPGYRAIVAADIADVQSTTEAAAAHEAELNNEAGLMAALSDIANFLQDNEGFTGQVTVQEFVEDDTTPDVSLAALMTNNVYYTNAANATTITRFDDGDDHSEFGDGDWFILRVDDANTTIDFSENEYIEGNAGVDFTGSATQIVYILFIYEDARWNAVSFTSGLKSPTQFGISSINMNSGLISQECCEPFTIIEPDLAQAASDDIKLKKFCAEAYPYGVTVTAIHIETDGTDISDTFLFEQWDDADGSSQVTLESIGLSATDTGEDDGDMSSTDIPADHFFSVNLDDSSDDYKLVIITLCYTIDPS